MDELIMNEIVREMTRDELIAENNKLRAEIKKLQEAPCVNSDEFDRLRQQIQALQSSLETAHNQERLQYRDGVIYGLKYALRCNGVSGGEIEREV